MRPAGIVLAGGPATRLGGQHKALLEIGGEPILARVLAAVAPLCAEVLLVVKDAAPFQPWQGQVRLVLDGDPLASPAAGLRAGLTASSRDLNLVVAADLPFLDGELLAALVVDAAGHDAAVLRWHGLPEPLQAVYHRRCLAPLQANLAAGEAALWKLLLRLQVRFRDLPGEAPPRCCFNVNGPEDLRRAREMAGEAV